MSCRPFELNAIVPQFTEICDFCVTQKDRERFLTKVSKMTRNKKRKDGSYSSLKTFKLKVLIVQYTSVFARHGIFVGSERLSPFTER